MSVSLLCALALACSGCSRGDPPESRETGGSAMRREKVRLRVDDTTLAGNDAIAIIEPVLWSANPYGSLQEYEASLRRFSRPQRLVFALHSYIAEVNNGGHEQFYLNSSGIVWPDAIEGFEAIGVPEGAEILRESGRRLGGLPSREREARVREIEVRRADFADLDGRFDSLQSRVDLDARMLDYARRHPAEFYFEGEVERDVPGPPPRP